MDGCSIAYRKYADNNIIDGSRQVKGEEEKAMRWLSDGLSSK